MRLSRGKALALAGAGALALAIPAIGQQGPESLLPPGFGDNSPPPAAPAQPSTPDATATPPAPGDTAETLTLTPQDLGEAANAVDEADNAAIAEDKKFDLPEDRRRGLDLVGLTEEAPYGFGADAFGGADGIFLSTLMRGLDAPIASRWAEIMLRRALVTRVPTPARVDGADWIAERVWLLLRLGEADAARMLVDQVDVDRYTPKLLEVATQAALATADPAGLCALAEPARTMSKEEVWPLARAMCAALSGEPSIAAALLDQARQGRAVKGIDLLLAEKVVGAGANGRRAVHIEWDDVDQLTGWRFGLASALDVPIPDRLFATVGPHVRAWAARAPMTLPEGRVAPARVAATLGVFSNAALVDLYGAVADRTDPGQLGKSTAGQLRTAYAGQDDQSKLAAMRLLWSAGDGSTSLDRYAGLILTARAAARIDPEKADAADVGNLVAAMFTAGLDRQAEKWAKVAENAGGDSGNRAWSILAVGAPARVVDVDASHVRSFADAQGSVSGRLLLAALAGLGRIGQRDAADTAGALGVDLGGQDRWTRALDRAVAGQQKGTVALLAAIGMQTPDWRGVPPGHFYRLLAALSAVGMEGEARMIAAEAMSRL